MTRNNNQPPLPNNTKTNNNSVKANRTYLTSPHTTLQLVNQLTQPKIIYNITVKTSFTFLTALFPSIHTPTFPLKEKDCSSNPTNQFTPLLKTSPLKATSTTSNQHYPINSINSRIHQLNRITQTSAPWFEELFFSFRSAHSESSSCHPNISNHDNKVEHHVPSVLHDPPPQNLLSSISSTITQQSQGGKPCHQQGLRQPSGILVPTTTFKHKHQNNKILPACLSDPAAARLITWP